MKTTVDILVVQFAYGGNGGISSTIPELAQWLVKTVIEMKADERIGRIEPLILSDTPICMTRNRAVKIARERGYDFILMLDSDNLPDGYLGHDPHATPFWKTAFDFSHQRLLKGIPTCIAAPYCGPPPHPVERAGIFDGGEVPYLFQWTNRESHDVNTPHKLDILTRGDAAKLSGIHPMAALPTGCCLFSTSCFDGPPKPYFKYEWTDEDESEKGSTEDVYATRNISLYWSMTKGIDVCFATCSSWALHYKPKKVGRPYVIPVETVAKNMRDALAVGLSVKESVVSVDYTEGLPAKKPVVTFGFIKPAQEAIAEAPPKNEPRQQEIDFSRLKRRWEVLGPNDNEVYISDDEYREIEAVAKMEAMGIVKSMEDKIAEALPPLPASNGKPLTSRLIGRHKVRVLGEKLPDAAVENIQNLARYVSEKNGGPIKAAVIRPGTGEGTAALLSVLPDDSRVHAYNWADPSRNSEYFKEAFKKDMDMGVVKADLDGKQAPDVSEHWSDMALFEDKPDEAQLERWFANVSPRGLLCGVGYESPDTKAVVDKFCDDYSLPVQESGGVWAVPVGDINHA